MEKFWNNIVGILKTNALLLFLPAIIKEGFAAIPEDWLKAEILTEVWKHKSELVKLSEGTATPIDDHALESFLTAGNKWLSQHDPKFAVLPELLDEFVQIGKA